LIYAIKKLPEETVKISIYTKSASINKLYIYSKKRYVWGYENSPGVEAEVSTPVAAPQ
jgi:hypothetical protein